MKLHRSSTTMNRPLPRPGSTNLVSATFYSCVARKFISTHKSRNSTSAKEVLHKLWARDKPEDSQSFGEKIKFQ